MTYSRLFLLAFASMTIGMAGSYAQTQPKGDLIPPTNSQTAQATLAPLDGETHPPLKLTPDKSELVRLNKEAASVVVGNPAHITVLLDTPKLAVVVPRQAGATHFSILDKEGNVIMQRHVIVASPRKNYVRIRRSCSKAAQGVACQPTSVYFCPDMCHEIGSGSGGNSPE